MLVIGPLLTFATAAAALTWGGRAEREAAALAVAATLAAIVLHAGLRLDGQLPTALADVLLLGGFARLAVRHRRPWLYAEAAAAFVLVGAQLLCADPLELSPAFRLFVNTVDLVILAVLLAGVARSARSRAPSRRAGRGRLS